MWRYDGIRAGQGATLVESRQTAYDANPIVKAAPVKYIQYRAKKFAQGTLVYLDLTHDASFKKTVAATLNRDLRLSC